MCVCVCIMYVCMYVQYMCVPKLPTVSFFDADPVLLRLDNHLKKHLRCASIHSAKDRRIRTGSVHAIQDSASETARKKRTKGGE